MAKKKTRRQQRRPNQKHLDRVLVRVIATKREKHWIMKWHDGANPRQRSTGVPAKRQLRALAESKGREWEDQLNDVRANSTETDWTEFCVRYSQDHLSGLAEKTREAWNTAESTFKDLMNPHLVRDISDETLIGFVGKLRKTNITETTIATYLRTIQAGLNWAERAGIITYAPYCQPPKRAKGKRMRGRPPTAEEYDRMCSVVPKVRPDEAAAFRELLNGLWLSGLRISEACKISWDWSAEFSVMLDGKYPMYKILAESEKGHSDRMLPIAPEFADWLSTVPKSKRRGRVFPINLAQSTIEKIIAAFGRKAGVVVNEKGKCATAQGLRRAFGTRWAFRVRPAVLQQLMRHESIETTMKYYV